MIIGASLLMLAGCTADDTEQADGLVPVRLSVSQECAVTRAADGLYTATTGFSGTETVKVFVNSSSADFTVGAADGTTHKSDLTAVSGTLYYPTSGDISLYGVYPSTSTSSHTVMYDQTSDANYQASDLMYATNTSVTQSNKAETQELQFRHQLVKLKVNIIKASDLTSVTEVMVKGVKRAVTVTPSASALTLGTPATATGETGTGANTDQILLFSGSNTSTEQQTYCCVFPAQEWSAADFITVTADGKTATYQLTKDFTAGSEYTLTLNLNTASLNNTVSITGWTDTQSATVNPAVVTEVTNAPAGAVAVDLNIIVGGKKILFANMNVGATSETDYGTYFAWGETSGYTVIGASATAAAGNVKTHFSWGTYAWCQGTAQTLTKYCPTDKDDHWWNATTVVPDNKTQLELGDDAARANWGGNWRMPTYEELTALYATMSTSGYTWTWCDGALTKYNGSTVLGWQITCTATSGTIFLPSAGYRYNSSFSSQSLLGFYWSSSLYSDGPHNAWYLYLYSENEWKDSEGSRCWGCTVRPVWSN